MKMDKIALYIHIPFCVKKCKYCDFNSYVARDLIPNYMSALKKEISLYKSMGRSVKTIYIGGGTPTILAEKDLESLILCIQENFKVDADVEFTVEANPGTLTCKKLTTLKNLGVNRLSLGLQAYQDGLLRMMGRIHTVKDFEQSFHDARDAGFDNINVDVIFGLPRQTLSDFMQTLEKVVKLSPEHISCYSLTVEEGTEFYRLLKMGALELPDEITEREMYHKGEAYLKERGYIHYEISNFAKPGRMSRHNMVYWQYGDYLGLGAGAHSFIDRCRYYNFYSPEKYMDLLSKNILPVEKREYLDRKSQEGEFCFLGFRLIRGLNKQSFKDLFGEDIRDIYGKAIEKLKNEGLIVEDKDYLRLTLKGQDLANEVFVEFLP